MSWYAVHTVFSVSDGTVHGRRDLSYNDVVECEGAECAGDEAVRTHSDIVERMRGYVREQGIVECEDRHEAMDLMLKW